MTTVTDADGNYQFVGLGVGTYRVSIVDPNTGVLAGLTNTQAYTGRGATQAPVTSPIPRSRALTLASSSRQRSATACGTIRITTALTMVSPEFPA